MQFKDLELEAISFKDTPTKTQVVNALRGVEKFLERTGGALVLDGAYRVSDEAVAVLFNAAIQLRGAADRFEQGPNQSGLAVPVPPGQPGPRRVV